MRPPRDPKIVSVRVTSVTASPLFAYTLDALHRLAVLSPHLQFPAVQQQQQQQSRCQIRVRVPSQTSLQLQWLPLLFPSPLSLLSLRQKHHPSPRS